VNVAARLEEANTKQRWAVSENAVPPIGELGVATAAICRQSSRKRH